MSDKLLTIDILDTEIQREVLLDLIAESPGTRLKTEDMIYDIISPHLMKAMREKAEEIKSNV